MAQQLRALAEFSSQHQSWAAHTVTPAPEDLIAHLFQTPQAPALIHISKIYKVLKIQQETNQSIFKTGQKSEWTVADFLGLPVPKSRHKDLLSKFCPSLGLPRWLS